MTKQSAIEDAIRKVDSDRLMQSQRTGQNYQQIVKQRLVDKRSQKDKDYDAEIELLAALQPNGITMHSMAHVLKRR